MIDKAPTNQDSVVVEILNRATQWVHIGPPGMNSQNVLGWSTIYQTIKNLKLTGELTKSNGSASIMEFFLLFIILPNTFATITRASTRTFINAVTRTTA
ncbi:MAG TPA: hypothetical protein VJS91_02855 [Nitrososphaeraceae archaeon]|nr:hypothetical protein [Nitrososphaeraceae archaeon]